MSVQRVWEEDEEGVVAESATIKRKVSAPAVRSALKSSAISDPDSWKERETGKLPTLCIDTSDIAIKHISYGNFNQIWNFHYMNLPALWGASLPCCSS